MRHVAFALVLAVVAFVACNDLPDAPRGDVVAPPAPAPAAAAAVPTSVGSTLCEAFQDQLARARESLEIYPGDAELRSREETLAAITADVCG